MIRLLNSWFFSNLRRITTQHTYLPFVDGLRWIAIMWVILYHLNGQLMKKTQLLFHEDPHQSLASWISTPGNYGVQLFFVISGFILSLPFAKAIRGQTPPVALKAYYLRRLTRIEPPYIISLIGLWIALGIDKGFDYAQSLWPELLYGLFYLSSLITGELNPINCVIWSLEIEVQFYLVAPLFMYSFCLNPILRKMLWIAVMVLIGLCDYPLWLERTLIAHLPYFLIGFLLTDLYLSQPKAQSTAASSWIALLLAGSCMIFLIIISHYHWWVDILRPWIYFIFIIAAFHARWLKSCLESLPITAIGGMCYSLYLLHFPLIAVFSRIWIDTGTWLHYTAYFIFQFCLTMPGVLVLSTLFYKIVERPCMDPDWPNKLKNWIINRLNHLQNR